MSVDRLHDLALEIAQQVLAARTDAEYGEVGVKAKNFAPTEDLIELAKQLMAEENRRLTLLARGREQSSLPSAIRRRQRSRSFRSRRSR